MEGLERIKVLASEITDDALLEIIKYLLSREDMNEKYLNEEKSLKQMVQFIKGEARKKAQNGVAILKDDEVFSLAIHYWDEDNKDLGLKESPVISGKSPVKSGLEEKNETTSATPLQTSANISTEKPKKSSKNYVPEGQLTLF